MPRLAAPALLAAALAAPAAALAATEPPVSYPDRASLARSQPVFTWQPGPGGEVVNFISIRPRSRASEEDPQTIRNLAGKRRATTHGALNAGTYHWSVGWSTAPGVSPYENGVSRERTFTIPPVARQVRITGIRQSPRRVYVSVTATYRTNLPKVRVTCRILDGRRVVSTQVLRGEDANSFNFTSQARCVLLRVPESLDGKRLRAEVTVSSGRTSAKGAKVFTAS